MRCSPTTTTTNATICTRLLDTRRQALVADQKPLFWTRSGSFFFECWGYTKKKHLSFSLESPVLSQVFFWFG